MYGIFFKKIQPSVGVLFKKYLKVKRCSKLNDYPAYQLSYNIVHITIILKSVTSKD